MIIEVKDEALGDLRLTQDEARLDFAVGLYTDGRVTLGRAAGIADRSQSEFQQELGRRGISVHYDVQDLHDDLDLLVAGRAVAKKEGLKVTGLLGVLVEAKKQNLTPRVGQLISELESRAGFRVSKATKIEAIRLAGESS